MLLSISRRRVTGAVFLTILLICSFSYAAFAQDDEPDAPALFNKGQDAHEKGDFLTAVKFYDEVIKAAPEFPEAEYQRGAALVSLGKTADAEKSFRRALELREDWTLAMSALGALLVRQNKFPEAEKILVKSIELDEQNFPAYVALAELRLKTKAAPDVLKELLTKLQTLSGKVRPTAAVWAARGAIERALGDKAARASLNRALELDANSSYARAERAELSLAEGDFNGALADQKALEKISPNPNDAKILLARIYAAQGKLADAQKILDALDAADTNVAALKNSLAAANSTDSATLVKQLETEPKNASLLGRLCTLTRQSDPPKSLEYCRRAAEAEPGNISHAVGFGAALVQAKRFADAVTILRRIVQIAPDNVTARANLATALFELKNYAAAKTEFQWLTAKNPDTPIAYYFLAIAHDNLAEYMDAMANYQEFLRRADPQQNQLEIDKVNLRLPSLQKQIKEMDKKGKKQ